MLPINISVCIIVAIEHVEDECTCISVWRYVEKRLLRPSPTRIELLPFCSYMAAILNLKITDL